MSYIARRHIGVCKPIVPLACKFPINHQTAPIADKGSCSCLGCSLKLISPSSEVWPWKGYPLKSRKSKLLEDSAEHLKEIWRPNTSPWAAGRDLRKWVSSWSVKHPHCQGGGDILCKSKNRIPAIAHFHFRRTGLNMDMSMQRLLWDWFFPSSLNPLLSVIRTRVHYQPC